MFVIFEAKEVTRYFCIIYVNESNKRHFFNYGIFYPSIICGQSSLIHHKISIGAIRWDAWCGNLNKAGLEVERTLGPEQYHCRIPFYGKIISRDSVECRCTTQSVINKEINYAVKAGIDYWAFCWYPNRSGLDTAMHLYLNSKQKVGLHWCVILGTSPLNNKKDIAWLCHQFSTTDYQKVLDNRPLVYIWNNGISMATLAELQLQNKQQGNKDIYFVIMDEVSEKAANTALTLKADAISAYTTWAYNNGNDYAPLVPQTEVKRWNEHMATGLQVIPWVTTGRNSKPRIDNPVSWTTVPAEQWTKDATPEQIAAHLKEAIEWIKCNPLSTKSNSLLIYAWNEFDEGGWICPTYGPDTSRLSAIRKVLMKYNK